MRIPGPLREHGGRSTSRQRGALRCRHAPACVTRPRASTPVRTPAARRQSGKRGLASFGRFRRPHRQSTVRAAAQQWYPSAPTLAERYRTRRLPPPGSVPGVAARRCISAGKASRRIAAFPPSTRPHASGPALPTPPRRKRSGFSTVLSCRAPGVRLRTFRKGLSRRYLKLIRRSLWCRLALAVIANGTRLGATFSGKGSSCGYDPWRARLHS